MGYISHLKRYFKLFLEEKREIFSCSAFRSYVFDEYQSALIPRKLLCQTNSGYAPVLAD